MKVIVFLAILHSKILVLNVYQQPVWQTRHKEIIRVETHNKESCERILKRAVEFKNSIHDSPKTRYFSGGCERAE